MKTILKIIIALLCAIVVAVSLRSCAVSSYAVPSTGMESTLYQGEHIFVNKWSYGLRLPFMGLWGYHRIAGEQARSGDIIVFNNPAQTDKSVSSRDVFIGRCMAAPGETLYLDDKFYVSKTRLSNDTLLRPIAVPRKGMKIRVEPWNITLLLNTLVMHEHRKAEIKNGVLYVNGKETQECTFNKDYYWVTSDNWNNVSDSRLFGFVPEDHLIGRAGRIWFTRKEGRLWTKVQ